MRGSESRGPVADKGRSARRRQWRRTLRPVSYCGKPDRHSVPASRETHRRAVQFAARPSRQPGVSHGFGLRVHPPVARRHPCFPPRSRTGNKRKSSNNHDIARSKPFVMLAQGRPPRFLALSADDQEQKRGSCKWPSLKTCWGRCPKPIVHSPRRLMAATGDGEASPESPLSGCCWPPSPCRARRRRSRSTTTAAR